LLKFVENTADSFFPDTMCMRLNGRYYFMTGGNW